MVLAMVMLAASLIPQKPRRTYRRRTVILRPITSSFLLPVEFITPAGDPVTQPKAAGDGQNEFTFNDAYPGVLEINLKVKVLGIGGMPVDIQNKFTFEIDGIGNSQMQWDAANLGGKPTCNGDFMTARVKYTVLPKHNSDFGKKMARIKFDGTVVAKEDFEVFFDKFASNSPIGLGENGKPNWFYYWKEGNVCGIPEDALYISGAVLGHSGSTMNGKIALADAATGKAKNYVFTNKFTSAEVKIGNSNLTGIDSCAAVVAHEQEHIKMEGFSGNDIDEDGIVDSYEEDYKGISSEVDLLKNKDTRDSYNLKDISEVYATYGDNEIRARYAEHNHNIKVYPSRDWANPGKNSKNDW